MFVSYVSKENVVYDGLSVLSANQLSPIVSLIVYPSLCGHQKTTPRLGMTIHPKAWKLLYTGPRH